MKLILVILFLSFNLCGQVKKKEFLRNVGDIEFDESKDDPNFKVCNDQKCFQYFNSPNGYPYKGEKIAVESFVKTSVETSPTNENGYITVRFIVNCEGKSGRFRIEEMSFDLEKKKFSKELVDKLLKATKELDGWIIASNGSVNFDYYQYLTFKIENGIIVEVLP